MSPEFKKAEDLQKELRRLADPVKARVLQGFFKTGPGEYGEGDLFLGVVIPVLRGLVKRTAGFSFSELSKLLASPFHEDRMMAVLILAKQFQESDKNGRGKVYRFYLQNLDRINNWDLVDVSAPGVVGAYLLEQNKKIPSALSKSKDLWRRRVAMISTFAFIRKGRFEETFRLAEALIQDEHDLMHKASGWMLREAGKRNPERLKEFLEKFAPRMPRTMLRYAIEKFPQARRQRYLRMKRKDH